MWAYSEKFGHELLGPYLNDHPADAADKRQGRGDGLYRVKEMEVQGYHDVKIVESRLRFAWGNCTKLVLWEIDRKFGHLGDDGLGRLPEGFLFLT